MKLRLLTGHCRLSIADRPLFAGEFLSRRPRNSTGNAQLAPGNGIRRRRLNLILLVFIVAGFCRSAGAQQNGVITGRVVAEDGGGLPNMTVSLSVAGSFRAGGYRSVATDDEGNFKFSNLEPRSYSISARASRGYTQAPLSAAERQKERVYHIGDSVTITMIRGGVINGRVTNSVGEPVILMTVAAIMVRDADGNRVNARAVSRSTSTDDRGVYRLYGLPPGTYLVVANGGGRSFSPTSAAYEGEAPVYHPAAATRDTATEVKVTAGGEITGVDIRYLGERGHTVSGRVIGGEFGANRTDANVILVEEGDGGAERSTYVGMRDGAGGFAFNGAPDGEYVLIAESRDYDRERNMASAPRRVSVNGADVSGIELRLAPLASIAGRVVVESTPNVCDPQQKIRFEEILLNLRRDDRAQGSTPFPFQFASSGRAPDEKGEFIIRNLNPGQYRLDPQLPGDNFYVKSISIPASPAGRASSDNASARSVFALKSGERLTGLTVAISDGASALSGKVVPSKEDERSPRLMRLRLHLIPAEAAAAGDPRRYAETLVNGEGAFSFTNVQPGRYLLLARAVPEDEPSDKPAPPVAWDSAERAKLRREAEAAKNEIELKPCQRVKDHNLIHEAARRGAESN